MMCDQKVPVPWLHARMPGGCCDGSGLPEIVQMWWLESGFLGAYWRRCKSVHGKEMVSPLLTHKKEPFVK